MYRSAPSGKTGFYIAVVAGTLLLMLPAFYNGYPILNPDDATYLLSGFKLETPFDRPITYGLLLRIFSINGWSLWTALFFQCYLVSWLLVKTATVSGISAVKTYILLPFLILLTNLCWVCATLIPDIFTPVSYLCLFLLLAGGQTRKDSTLLFVLYTVSVATHMSHVLIFVMLLSVVLVFRKRLFPENLVRQSSRYALLLMVLTFATVLTMGSALSKSKHVFFMAAMLDQGILKEYLDEKCPASDFAICGYKDKLPANANEFLWNPESPVYATGGWAANKKEYNQIINGTLTSPRYIGKHIAASLRFTAMQFTQFSTGSGNTPFVKGTNLYDVVHEYLPADAACFDAARQQQNTLVSSFTLPTIIMYIITIVSLVVIGCFLTFRFGLLSIQLRFLLITSLLLIVINIWDCATFAQVNARYGNRVMWLVAFNAIILVTPRKQFAGKQPGS